jgi:hypothetical protein
VVPFNAGANVRQVIAGQRVDRIGLVGMAPYVGIVDARREGEQVRQAVSI